MELKLLPCPICHGVELAFNCTSGLVSCSNQTCRLHKFLFTVNDWNNKTEPLFAILMQPIDDFGLTYRACNALKKYGVHTMGDIFRLGILELYKIPNLGKISIADILLTINDIRIAHNKGVACSQS